MTDPDLIKQLKSALHSQTLLYVEDNAGLNAQATRLFQNLFDNPVLTAFDGKEGLELFKKHHPSIVITDIKMPKMDGLAMAKEILHLDSEVKIIFTTAYDRPEFIREALRIGSFDYLVKPITIQDIVDVLMRCAKEINAQMHQKLFYAYLNNVFNYQQNLVLLLHHETVVMANQPCLEFFGAPNVETFQKRFINFGDLLLEHSGFLYNHDSIEWLKETKNNPGKLFNVKIADTKDESHHFVLSLGTIPNKTEYYVLSLNDVSELNLLRLFDANAMERETLQKDKKALKGLLEMAKRNSAKVQLHNLYKGLSITNNGIIYEVEEDHVSIKTSLMQIKAIQYEKRVVIVSDIFPMFIESIDILKLDFDQQTVILGECKMASTSPTRRQYIRVTPNSDEAKATLLYQGHRFDADITISDISIKSARLNISNLPAGFQIGSKVILDIVLGTPQRPLIINTEAEAYRISEVGRHYEAVFVYNIHGPIYKQLVDYIAKQQMYLIREFKGMQNG